MRIMVMPMKKSGGPGIFLHRLIKYMQEYEMIQVVDSKPDIYFSTVWRGKPPKRCKTVYRAASVYYNSHDKKRKGLNKRLAAAIRDSDYVVYQTHFARKLCEKVLGRYFNYKVKARRKSIIVNGFDGTEYDNIKPAKQKCKYRFVACSDWSAAVKRGMVIVKGFRRAKIEDSELIMIGKITPKRMPVKRKYIKSGRIKLLGSQPMNKVVPWLKSNSIFVHLSYAESCPNAAIEALSFGCPVICNNIGGTPEVVKDSGIIAQCDKNFVFRRRPVDITVHNFGTIVDAFREATNREWHIHREDLSMSRCAMEYKQVFENVLGV